MLASNLRSILFGPRIVKNLLVWGEGRSYALGTQSFLDVTPPKLLNFEATLAKTGGNFDGASDNEDQSLTYMLVIAADGTLWGCGSNWYGALANGGEVSGSSPFFIPKLTRISNSTWSKIATDRYGSIAIRSDGTLWTCGDNTQYITGEYNFHQETLYQPMPGHTFTKIWHNKEAESTTWAIRSDGTLWACGSIRYGLFGNGPKNYVPSTTGDYGSTEFVQIGTDTDWVDIKDYTAKKANGTLWRWGYSGMFGLSSTNFSPIQIGTDTDWATIYTSAYGSAWAIKNDGTLWAWGTSTNGSLGTGLANGTVNNPTQIGSATWSKISSCRNRSAGIQSDGTLWIWGLDNGQKNSPVKVGTDTWIDVCVYNGWTFGIKSDGTMWSWGLNNEGQLGVGDLLTKSSPTQVGTDTDWAKLPDNEGKNNLWNFPYSHAIKSNGSLYGCGYNAKFSIGDGSAVRRLSMVLVDSGNWDKIIYSAGTTTDEMVTTGRKTDGSIYVWGTNFLSSSSIPHTQFMGIGQDSASTPTRVGADTWSLITDGSNAGQYASAYLKSDGTLWTWGYNFWGQVGNGKSKLKVHLGQIGTDTDWADADASYSQVLLLKTNGTLWWYGKILNPNTGSTTPSISPIQVGSATWNKISVGNSLCAIKSDNTLWGCGYNDYGELGTGNKTQVSTMTQISSAKWREVSMSSYHTLAIKTDGTLWAWGNNASGQLGTGDTTERLVPTQIGTDTDWLTVIAMGADSCSFGIKTNGDVYSWGDSSSYQLGYSTGGNVLVPTIVPELKDYMIFGGVKDQNTFGGLPVCAVKNGYSIKPLNGRWVFRVKIGNPVVGAVNQFGYSNAITGDGKTILSGIYNYSNSQTWQGAWERYDWSTNANDYIIRDSTHVSPNVRYYERFGSSLAINSSGSIAVVAGEGDYYNSQLGRVYTYDISGGIFTPRANYYAESGYFTTYFLMQSYWGRSVDISNDGNTLVVGAPNYPHPITYPYHSGAVFTYDWNGSNWTIRGVPLLPPDLQLISVDGQMFAWGMAISGDGNVLAVGMPGWKEGVQGDQGCVYIFDKSGNTWVQRSKIIGSYVVNARFGNSLALSADGNYLLVNAPQETIFLDPYYYTVAGATHSYRWNSLTSQWVEYAPIVTAPDFMISPGYTQFGRYGVSISDDAMVCAISSSTSGAAEGQDPPNNDGCVYIFDWVED